MARSTLKHSPESLLDVRHTDSLRPTHKRGSGVACKPQKARTMLAQWLLISLIAKTIAYDPNDKSLKDILLPEGRFEAFYLKGSQEEEQNAVRPPHLHGSFHQYKNPALVGAPNSAAYGFRFDGKRRFNYN